MKFSFSFSYLAFIHCFHISNLCQNKCLNNGTCIINSEDKRESCLCTTAFTGDRCQINIDECSSSPCLHGGLCIDGLGEFICSCREGKQERKICMAHPDVVNSHLDNRMFIYVKVSLHLTKRCCFSHTHRQLNKWFAILYWIEIYKKSRICTYVVILEINEYSLS